MSATCRPTAPCTVIAAVLGVVLILGVAGCALLDPRPHPTPMVTLTLGRCAPSAEVAVLDRGPASLVWPEFRDMVTGTARCGEHLMVIDARSGRQLGSFVVPPSPTMRVPAPPPPLASGATSFQVSKHKKAVAAYRALINRDLAHLRGRAHRQLAAWVALVITRVRGGNEVGLDPAGRTLAAAFDSAAADLNSLGQSGVAVGDQKVLAVLGLQGLSDSAPKLSAGLGSACVVVTGFPPSPYLRRAWRSELRWQGARSVVLLTRAVIDRLPAVVADCLAGR
jgi:hypothetical protein